MKKSIAILSAVIGALVGATTSAIAISEKRRRFKKACDESLANAINASCEALKNKPRYDFSGVEVVHDSKEEAVEDTASEKDLYGTDNRGRMVTPKAIVMDLPEAGRRVELGTDGVVRCYEDDKLVVARQPEHWPEGNFKIHYYRTLGMASRFAYLFFEEIEEDSCFCKAVFTKNGYFPMSHVIVLDESLNQVPISYPKGKKDSGDFRIGDSRVDEYFGGKNVMLRVPNYVMRKELQGTLKDFVFVGEDDDEFYLCDIENFKVVRKRNCYLSGRKDYALIGWNMVADLGDYYMICNFGEINNSFPAKFFKDSFGKHNFAKFKAVCGQCLDDSALFIRPVFYEEISAPKEEEKK